MALGQSSGDGNTGFIDSRIAGTDKPLEAGSKRETIMSRMESSFLVLCELTS